MRENELIVCDGTWDKPGKYDIEYSEYAEGLVNKGQILDKYSLKIRNQNQNEDTLCGCSVYGATYCYNGYQLREYDNSGLEFEQEDPRWKWLAFQAERGYPANLGASLQDVIKFFKKRGLIDGYVVCKTYQECINALNNGFLILSGSAKCSWSKSSTAKSFVYDANGAKHCFAIVQEKNGVLRGVNSFGEKWGDKGYFDIPNEHYKDIYTTYALIDHDDTGKLQDLVFKAQYQKAIEEGITNGTRPNDPVTRMEASVMCYRVYKKLLNNK